MIHNQTICQVALDIQTESSHASAVITWGHMETSQTLSPGVLAQDDFIGMKCCSVKHMTDCKP